MIEVSVTKNNNIQVRIETKSKQECTAIGTTIHDQLVGNQDYIDCNIILNIDNGNDIFIWVDPICKEIPEVRIVTPDETTTLRALVEPRLKR